MSKKSITTESELYQTLTDFYRNYMLPSSYPVPAVALVLNLLKEIPNGLDAGRILGRTDNLRGTILFDLLTMMATPYGKKQKSPQMRCAPALVRFACRVADEMAVSGHVTFEHANRILVWVFLQQSGDYAVNFVEVFEDNSWWLCSSKALEDELKFSVRVPQSQSYAHYLTLEKAA
ncbi:hypothetical protein [Microvirga pudoricolor]|uniref:hypothetical protein n=1 Tax=Microvirga pudoricolor TaxID=2778729 RepID=UPI00195209E5|nr:hypothetical protein [Microvirga pudoricolor]MBM6596500.1 hypothetical protein [Microvirga pudoricolor]